MNYKKLVDDLAHSEIARNAYDAVSRKWGAVGVAIALAACILAGALIFGYDVADIQRWFDGLGR